MGGCAFSRIAKRNNEIFFLSIDLLPKFVLKTDSDDFDDEFIHLQEVFGLDDLDLPTVEVITDVSLKNLYSQLERVDLDELTDLYHIDLHMFQYSPEKIYSIVKS